MVRTTPMHVLFSLSSSGCLSTVPKQLAGNPAGITRGISTSPLRTRNNSTRNN